MNVEPLTDHAEIRLTDGYIALVDADDWLWLSQWEWQAQVNVSKNGHEYVYALRSNKEAGPNKRLLMHRAILQAPPRVHVDHANHNTIDNRRCNIRLASCSQNAANRRIVRNQYGFKGISYVGGARPWSGHAEKDRVRYSIGYHATPEEAAAAYDALVTELWGEFAKTNASIRSEHFFDSGQSTALIPSTKAFIAPGGLP